MMAPVVVIGVGNPFRRDDGVGPAVLERLAGRVPAGVRLAESDGEPGALIELWEDVRLAIVVDAVRGTAGPGHARHPGRVHRLGVPRPGSPSGAASSHGVHLGAAIDLARVLARLPERMLLYGIEAGQLDFGVGLTGAVAASADRVAEEIRGVVAAEAARCRSEVA